MCMHTNIQVKVRLIELGHEAASGDDHMVLPMAAIDKLYHDVNRHQPSGKWGPFQVDLFADRLNRQLQSFVSWKPEPLSVSSDVFQMEWKICKLTHSPLSASSVDVFFAKLHTDQSQLVLIAPL